MDSLIGTDMLQRFNSWDIITTGLQLQWLVSINAGRRGGEIDQDTRRRFLDALRELEAGSEILGLSHTTEIIALHRHDVKANRRVTYAHLESVAENVRVSLNTEANHQILLFLPLEKSKYLETGQLLGEDVCNAFPSAEWDIEQAGNCYALGNDTACIFHLMRVLEIGLQSLARHLSVVFEDRNWHNIIADIESKIKSLGSAPRDQRPTDWKKQEHFLAGAAVQFRYFKDAWRNYVMHVRERYDEHQAMSVMARVREFMQQLAKGGLHD